MLPSGPDKKLASPNYYCKFSLKNSHFLDNTKYKNTKFPPRVERFFKVAEVENCYKFPTNPDKCALVKFIIHLEKCCSDFNICFKKVTSHCNIYC